MSDYTERVNALREHADLIETSIELYGPSATRLLVYDLRNAADAIEELQQIADHHEQSAKDYWKEACEYKAQLPKRGEWVGVSPMVDTVQCSVCGGELFSAELETPYCPYCGAKMEVQDGKD